MRGEQDRENKTAGAPERDGTATEAPTEGHYRISISIDMAEEERQGGKVPREH
jgi:hypothetical protein